MNSPKQQTFANRSKWIWHWSLWNTWFCNRFSSRWAIGAGVSRVFDHVPGAFPENMIGVVRAFPNKKGLFVGHTNRVRATHSLVERRVPKVSYSWPSFGSRETTIESGDNESHAPMYFDPRRLWNPTKDDDNLVWLNSLQHDLLYDVQSAESQRTCRHSIRCMSVKQ